MENPQSSPSKAQDPFIGPQGTLEIHHGGKLSHQNGKDYVVVWYDPKIHSSANEGYIKALEMMYNLQPFSDYEEALKYLKEDPPISCQVIVSGNTGETFVKEICNMSNIISIYVLHSNEEASVTWIKHFPKIVIVETEFTCILEKMSQDLIAYKNANPSIKPEQPNSAQTNDFVLGPETSETIKMQNQTSQNAKSSQTKDKEEEIRVMASVGEMVPLFMKKNTVIWFDPKADDTENQSRIDDLRAICGIQTFTDWKEVTQYLEYLEQGGSSLCQVILSDVDAKTLVKDISDYECVSWIYIFTEDEDIDKQTAWTNQYKKVLHVESDFTSLKEKIKERVGNSKKRKQTSLRTDLPSFAPIFDDMDRSDENYRHLYLTGFTKFKNRKQAKADFIGLAAKFYSEKSDLRDITEFEQGYDGYDMASILRWYTKESFVCKLTNNCLRIANSDSIQYCRLTLKDLETAIKDKYQQQSKHFSGLLYRGAYMSDKEWAKLQDNIGKDIEMHGFLSTSKNENVAINFCQEDLEKKVFITVIIPDFLVRDDQGFAEIKEYSDYSAEDEVLFNIMSRFTVLEAGVEEIDGSQMRHLALLYGAQAMRMFTRLMNPVIEIQLQSLEVSNSACRVCKKKINLEEDSILSIDITDDSEYICHQCLQKPELSLLQQPLVCILPSAHGLTNLSSEVTMDLTIRGSVTPYQENLNIPLYGYKCQICGISRPNNCFRCLECQDGKVAYCSQCFFDKQANKCAKQKHTIIFERRPFSVWTEKMMEKEVHRMNYQKQNNNYNHEDFQQGDIFKKTHKHRKQIEYYEKSLKLEKDVVRRSNILNKLGMAYHSVGEYRKAIDYHSKSLEIRNAVFGDTHPMTADSYNNHGSAYEKLGEYRKAIDYHSRSLEIRKAVFGDNHPHIAQSYNNIGSAYQSLGEYQKAIENHSRCLQIKKAVFGDHHPEVATSYNNLGSAYESLGEYQKAIEDYLLSLEIRKAVFGDNHPDTASSFNNLGNAYETMGEYQKAVNNHFLALEIMKALFGDNHPSIAASYNNLGSAYDSLGEYRKAIDYHSRSLEIKKAVFGDNHPDIALSYNNLGSTYEKLGEYQKAIENHSRSLEIVKAVFGDNHLSTATSYNNLGSAFEKLGQYQKAIDNHTRSLEITKLAVGDTHPMTAASYNNLGSAYTSLGEYQKSIEYYSRSLEIKKAVFGDNHPDVALAYNNLGSEYEKLGEYQKAIDYHFRSLEITKAAFGDTHPMTAISYSNLGLTYNSLGECQKAIDYHLRSLEIKKQCLETIIQIQLSHITTLDQHITNWGSIRKQ